MDSFGFSGSLIIFMDSLMFPKRIQQPALNSVPFSMDSRPDSSGGCFRPMPQRHPEDAWLEGSSSGSSDFIKRPF